MSPSRWAAPLLVLLFASACADSSPAADNGTEAYAQTVRDVQIPAELAAAEADYQANCSACHGERGLGTDAGPPLVHIIYEPNHHADIAFFMAVNRGVRAHHWQFGDMPPQPNVSNEQVERIVDYIRFLQRQVGIQ